MADDLLLEEQAFLKELASASVTERVKRLRRGFAKVRQVAEHLRELRKQQSDPALVTALLTDETLLLMALVDAEKAGVKTESLEEEGSW